MSLTHESTIDALLPLVRWNGFAVVPACLDSDTLKYLCEEFDENRHPERNVLSVPSVQNLATSKNVREVIERILGPRCFAVRGIFFNKTPNANWKVVWHQDLTIAVRERMELNGFGPWTKKAKIWHVQPPVDVMCGMLSIRLHLDESGLDNGPLRVISASHVHGRLSMDEIARYDKSHCVTCVVPRGGALLMRPLLLHASSACVMPKPRRVIHLEFGSMELPHGLDWQDRI